MKRTVFILIGMALCLVLAGKVQAQRCLPGMKGLRLTAGMADGFHSAGRRNELGYHFGLSMDSYTKGCSKWVFGTEYLQKYHPYKETRLPVSQFTAEGDITTTSSRMRTKCSSATWAARRWRVMKR